MYILATGNYNDSTAKLYTDCGIFTCDERFGEDATAVFNMLSGYSEPKRWNKLIVAPIWMKDRFVKLIAREAEHAKKGEKAHIVAKMNSLCDPVIIAALYYASSCGVKIDLLVRGICCLKVGIPGVSENIHVRSIVGNFLEHARIFYFKWWQMMRGVTWEARTGCHVIWIVVWRSFFRLKMRPDQERNPACAGI